MKKIALLIVLPWVVSCYSQSKNNQREFLERFPTRTIYCLDSIKFYLTKGKSLLDTISPISINKIIWKDETGGRDLGGGKINNRLELIDSQYRTGIFGSPFPDELVYPIAKIDFEHCFGLLYLVQSHYNPHDGSSVNLHFFDNTMNHVSGLAFKYAPLNERVTDLVFPEVMDDKHFLVTNIIAEGIVNPNMHSEKWLVQVRDDAMLHVVWMRSNWMEKVEGSILFEDDFVEIRSVFDYVVKDPDGFSNLRQAPTTKSEVLERIPVNQKFMVLDVSKKWWLVKSQKGNIGYLHKSRIKTNYRDR